MADIVQQFAIEASCPQVFQAVSTPTGLDTWWTKRSSGEPIEGAEYSLWFGPEHDWRAVVSRCIPHEEFELEVTEAQQDWLRTRVGFVLKEREGVLQVQFHHLGWPEANEHFRVSCYCWAMYLRLLKRYVERREVVPYEERLDA